MGTSYRFSKKVLRDYSSSGDHHEGLMAFKNEIFRTPEDLIIRSKRLLKEINERHNPAIRDFGIVREEDFVYLYEKFDTIYHQEQILLQSMFLETPEDQLINLQKESQSKKRLTDLFRCELLIHQTIQRSGKEIVSCLVSLLEVFFEDIENLELLLLLIFNKMAGGYKDKDDFYAKMIHFMLPCIKLFGGEGFDLMEIWKNRKESLEIPELINALIEDMKISLKDHTQLSEEEISTFLEEITPNTEHDNRRKINIRKICEKKKSFKEEKSYYHMLGNLSLLEYLCCTRYDNEESALAFLRLGSLAHIFNARFMQIKNSEIGDIIMDSLDTLRKTDFTVQFDLSSQMLKYALNKLEKQSQDHHYIRLLELQSIVIDILRSNVYLIREMTSGSGAEEKYYDLFLQEELYDAKTEECLWSRFYKFFTSNVSKLVEKESCYVINQSSYENLILVWGHFVGGTVSRSFTKQEEVDEKALRLKYFGVVFSNLEKVLTLISDGKLHLNRLQQNIQTMLVRIGELALQTDKKLLVNLDLNKLFGQIEQEGWIYLISLENNFNQGSHINYKLEFELIFMTLTKWIKSHIHDFGVNQDTTQLLEEMFAKSKLINNFLSMYRKKKTWINKIKDPVNRKTFVNFECSLLRLITCYPSTLENQEHKSAVTLILKDILASDNSHLNEEEYFELYEITEDVINVADVFGKCKEWKLLILFLKFFWLKPKLRNGGNDYTFGMILKSFGNNENEAEALIQLTQRFIIEIEEKLKNFSIDYLTNINKLQKQVDKEYKEEQRKKQSEDNSENSDSSGEAIWVFGEEPIQDNNEDDNKNEEAKEIESENNMRNSPEEEKEDRKANSKKEDFADDDEDFFDKKNYEMQISFNIDKDGKVFDQEALFVEFKGIAIRCCYNLQVVSYRTLTGTEDYFDENKDMCLAMVRKVAKMTFTPLLIFIDLKNYLSNIENYGRSIYYSRHELLGQIYEGICEGMIELCETFCLAEESTIDKINKANINNLLLRLQNCDSIGTKALPRDISWTEASLISLFIALMSFDDLFGDRFEPPFEMTSEFSTKFQQASALLLQLTAKLYKSLAEHISREQTNHEPDGWKIYSQKYMKTSETISKVSGIWARFCSAVYKKPAETSITREIYAKSLERLVIPTTEENTWINSKVQIACNLSILKEFTAFISSSEKLKSEIIAKLMLDIPTLKALIAMEKLAIEEYFKYPHRESEILISEILQTLTFLLSEDMINEKDIWAYYSQNNNVESIQRQIKDILPEFTKFIKELSLERIIKIKYSILTENISGVLSFVELLYSLYSRSLKEKVADIDKNIDAAEKETLKLSQEFQSKRLGKGETDIYEKHDEEQKQNLPEISHHMQQNHSEQSNATGEYEAMDFPAAQEAEGDYFMKLFELNMKKEEDEEYLKREAEESAKAGTKVEQYMQLRAEEDLENNKMKILKFKQEREALLAFYVQELLNYLETCLPHALYFTTAGNLLKLGEQFKVISRQFWIQQYEKIYGRILRFIQSILQNESDAFLKDEITKESLSLKKMPEEDIILDRTESSLLNIIMTFDFLLQYIQQFFEKEIAEDLKMSKAFIESLIVVVNILWKKILATDFTQFKKTIKIYGITANLSNIITDSCKILIDYIVAHTTTNFCVIDDNITTQEGTFQNFLLIAMEMAELSLSVHEHIIQVLKLSILEEFDQCYGTLINLINAILRSNKALRVDFLNKGILSKLLAITNFEFPGDNLTVPLLSLFSTLIEDSLTLESQIELAIKENEPNDESNHSISLDKIMESSTLKLLKNYKRFANTLNNYEIQQQEENASINHDPLSKGKFFINAQKGYVTIDYQQEIGGKNNSIEYLQQMISPISKKCLHLLVITLITNYLSEEESISCYIKKMRKSEAKRNKIKLKKAEGQNMSFDSDDDENEDESEIDKELSLLNKNVLFKQSTLLVVVLSSILQTYSYLVPYTIFQEIETSYLLEKLKEDDPIRILFSDRKRRYSALDVIIRLLLWRDGETTLFIVGALLNNEKLIEKDISLRYSFLLKIFEIMEEILDSEKASGTGLKSLESMLIRQNIIKLVSYISHNFIACFPQNEEEIQKIITNVIQKLLSNLDILALSIGSLSLQYGPLIGISDIIKKNMLETLDHMKIKENYGEILKALEQGYNGYDQVKKESTFSLDNKFDHFVFKSQENILEEKINIEDQKPFEIWDDKEQWEKEETKKLMAISNLKKNHDVRLELATPVIQSTQIFTDAQFSDIYAKNIEDVESLVKFYRGFERNGSKNFGDRNSYFDYYTYWRDTNRTLQDLSDSISQSFGCETDQETRPTILRYKDTKSQELEKETNITALYIEQLVNRQSTLSPQVVKEINKDIGNDQSEELQPNKDINAKETEEEQERIQEFEKNQRQESEQKIEQESDQLNSDLDVEEQNVMDSTLMKNEEEQSQIIQPEDANQGSEEVKLEQEKQANEEEKEREGEILVDEKGNLIVRYFYNDNVRDESHLKYQVNKALRKGKKLKEAICVESTLREVAGKNLKDFNVDDMIHLFTKKMRIFDRNVIYVNLGKGIRSLLSEKTRKEVEKMEKEFKKMKEDYDAYSSGLALVSEENQKKEAAAAAQINNNEEEKDNKDSRANYGQNNIDNVSEKELSNQQNIESSKPAEIEDNRFIEEEEADCFGGMNLDEEEEEEEEPYERETKEEDLNQLEGLQADQAEDVIVDNNDNIEEEEESEDSTEEASEYEGLDDDFRFINYEGYKNENNEQQSEEQLSQISNLSRAEEEKNDEIKEEQKEVSADVSKRMNDSAHITDKKVPDEVKKLINSFRFEDKFILDLCTLFFAKYSEDTLGDIIAFLKDAVTLNPVNDLRLLDTLFFILYTPEFLEDTENENGLSFPPKNYIFAAEKITPQTLFKKVASNIISYLATSMRDNERSYVFFTPAKFLNKFGNKMLVPFKEKSDYCKKIEKNYSILDMMIGLLDNSLIIEAEGCAANIIDAVKTLLSTEKKIVLGTSSPQKITLDPLLKYFSHKNIIILFNLLCNPRINTLDLQDKMEQLFDVFKSLPELFLSLQDSLNDYTLTLIPSINKILEDNIKTLKLSKSKLTKQDIAKVIVNLNVGQLQTFKVIFGSFVGIIYHYLFTDAKKSIKMSKKMYSLLKLLTQDLFATENLQNFMLNIYEIADLISKGKEGLNISNSYAELPLDAITKLCLYHYSIIIMHSSCELNTEKTQKKKSVESNSDIDQLPQLVKLISYDENDATNEMAHLRKTFSHYKNQNNINFKAVFANFGLKYSKIISQLFQTTKTKKDSAISYALTILLPRCPWILDLATKRQIMKDKITKHLEDCGVPYLEDNRSITIDRDRLVPSTIKEFINVSRNDMLLDLNISYKNERGIDGGGLRREFFSLIAKELFDPNIGLFRVSDNQLSIQPSLISGIVPHHLMLFEFAGIILAKIIQGDAVVDLHFTRSFLKHILDKEITIADLEDIDAGLSKNLQWIMQNNVEGSYLTFTHEEEVFGERIEIELAENGYDTFLNELNKKEYVKKVCEIRMIKEIENQVKAFMKGFNAILPKECFSHLSSGDLDLIIAGTPQVDFEEMKKYAEVTGHNPNSNPVKWLWEVLKEFNQEDLATFLYFVSGSSKVPYGGFKDHPITIAHSSKKEGLPIAHTCSYQIDLPEYDSKAELREKLLMAIFDGVGGFFIA